ncbi:MAG: DUF309 domain-containing protein [Thermoplasmatota archaeon]
MAPPVPLNTRRHPDAEPVADPAGDPLLEEGRALFNDGKHWHAHEAWEHLWLGLEGRDKLFVQGLIMAAAMLVQYGRGRFQGVLNHHENVLARLPEHAPTKWGIDVAGLLAQLAPFREAAARDDGSLDPADVQLVRDPTDQTA